MVDVGKFQSILNRQTEEVEEPKPFPVGSYRAKIIEYEFRESQQKGTPGVAFKFAFIEPMDDVDDDAFSEAGGMAKLQKRTLTETYWLTEDSLFRLKQFYEACGLATNGRTMDEVLPDTKNCEVILYITHREGQNPRPDGTKPVFMQVSSITKAE